MRITLVVVALGSLLAAHAAPPVAVAEAQPPATCSVAPREEASVAALLAPTPVADAAPTAPPAVASPGGIADDAWIGTEADPDAAAVEDLAREFAGCLNAADWPRLLALMTDEAVAEVAGPGDLGFFFGGAGKPVPTRDGTDAIETVAVRDVRQEPDGRVSAVVEWGIAAGDRQKVTSDAGFFVFARAGDRWLVDAGPVGVQIPGDAGRVLWRLEGGRWVVQRAALGTLGPDNATSYDIEAVVTVAWAPGDPEPAARCDLVSFFPSGDETAVEVWCEPGGPGRVDVEMVVESSVASGGRTVVGRCAEQAVMTARRPAHLYCAVQNPETGRADGAQGVAYAPSPCLVAPRTEDEVAELVAATPADAAEEPWIDDPSDLPFGEPADAETATGVVTTAREFAGCLNAADWPRWLALMTDDAVAWVLGGEDPSALFANVGTPFPGGPEGPTISAVVVRDARVLPDGRVGAVVEWDGAEANFHVFERVGDRWLLDEELAGNVG